MLRSDVDHDDSDEALMLRAGGGDHAAYELLVGRHLQQEIDLRPAQMDAIKRAMNETQQQLVDLQWRLDAESETLGKLLAAEHVDEAAVLGKLDQVTAIEQQVKKVNFTLLVRIKNQLDSQQQEKLRALRPAHPFGPPGGPPP